MALTDKLVAVADAIRGKTGKTEPLTLDQMPGEIAGIQSEGAEAFYTSDGKCYTTHMNIVGMAANSNAGCLNTLYRNAINLKSVLMEGGHISGNSSSVFSGCASLENAIIKNVTSYGHYWFTDCNSLREVQLGSIGFPVTSIGTPYLFQRVTRTFSATIYVDAETFANIPAAVTQNSPWSATNATIIYRNSTTGEVITE